MSEWSSLRPGQHRLKVWTRGRQARTDTQVVGDPKGRVQGGSAHFPHCRAAGSHGEEG